MFSPVPPGAGKGIGAVIPNLLSYPGSVLVLDIKGENHAVTSRYRSVALGQSVYRLDPFNVMGEGSHSINWLDFLNHRCPSVVSRASALADLLVVHESAGSPHWNEAAQDLIKGLILYVCTLPPQDRNISTLRRILTTSEHELLSILKDMSVSNECFGLLSKTAHMYLAKS